MRTLKRISKENALVLWSDHFLKTRFIQFVISAWLIIFSGHSVWSQSSLYFDRGEFIAVSEGIPGSQQSISYFSGPNGSFEIGPTLTISDVTFTGVLTHGKMLPKAGVVRASLPHDSGYPAQ